MFKTLTATVLRRPRAAPAAALAQETTIKFTLGWKTQGSDAAFFVARDKGYYKAEGLNVVIDQGEGSGATVTRIMGGAYDAGFGDVNAIIQNAAAKPGEAPVMVYMMWNQPPFAIVDARRRPASSSRQGSRRQDAGRRAGHADDAPAPGLRPQERRSTMSKIKLSNMAPNLQEPLLIKGDIDGALVFNITSYFNLVLNRQDPDKDFNWLIFGDYGLDLYSNGVMVSQKLLKENPKAVAGLVRAINKAMIEIAKDQDVGMKGVVELRQSRRRARREAPPAILLQQADRLAGDEGDRRRRHQGRPHGARHRHRRRGLRARTARPSPRKSSRATSCRRKADRELVYTAN